MDKIQKALLLGFLSLVLSPVAVFAHCDTMDGPVVRDARRAIESGNVQTVLKWVSVQDEVEIKQSFDDVLTARKDRPGEAEAADRQFFETVVRLHRKSEGIGFSELKPSGTQPLSITEADKVLQTGSTDSLLSVLTRDIAVGVNERFERAYATKQHAEESVEKGREYVAAYVEFMHYVEAVHDRSSPGHHHGE